MAGQKLSLPEKLRDPGKLEYWASRYPKFECDKDDWIEKIIQDARKNHGYLVHEDLRRLGIWKNGNERGSRHFTKDEDEIKCRTCEAFGTSRMEPLLGLAGLQRPMASSLMHFAFPHKFPIIDRRVLSALGMRPREGKAIYIGKQVWEEYRKYCLDTVGDYDVSLRVLDRALWQYDAEVSFWRKHSSKRSPDS